jgi:phosphatidylserine decarboxylase
MNILNNYCFYYDFKKIIFIIFFIFISYKTFFYKITIFLSFLLIFIYFFYRIPTINPISDNKFIHAPCYGVIKNIEKTNGFLHISTFIRLTDPHIQYIPYSGFLRNIFYKPGEFNPAYMIKKGKYNEKMIYHIETSKGIIMVSQIAGVIARTIVPFVKKNTIVNQNEELGLIKFGSRCDIFIPLSNPLKILVRPGDNIKGSYTKLVEFLN